LTPIQYSLLCVAAIPFVYYLLAIYSSLKFFRESRRDSRGAEDFTPPVSNLKPVRGLDAEAFENFASLCKQNYPEYELLFCTTDRTDPAVPVIQKLIQEFPDQKIRLLYSGRTQAINDKIAKLALMTSEARYEHLIINDSDVRVTPDYFRQVVAAFKDPKVGGVTCFYVSTEDKTLAESFQTIGMISDFYAGVLVAWKLQGLQFALGPTMATTKQRVRHFGGFRVLENRPADDLLLGRLIAQQGFEMKLLPYAVKTVPDYKGLGALMAKRTRWMTVMRAMRPWGHLGLLLTWGLPWSIVAVALRPCAAVAATYLGGYLLCRLTLSWIIGIYGLKQKRLWRKFAFIPLWDAMAFWIWLVSFTRKSILWRGVEHGLRSGQLVPPGQDTQTLRTREQRAPEGANRI
jgi:ceramide glucosyltransferase